MLAKPPPEHPDNPKTIMEIGSRDCRWPCSGEGVSTVFCGGAAVKDKPYCSRHARLAYKPKEPDRKDRVQFGSKFTKRTAIP